MEDNARTRLRAIASIIESLGQEVLSFAAYESDGAVRATLMVAADDIDHAVYAIELARTMAKKPDRDNL